MQRLTIAAITFIFIFLISCSKDDNEKQEILDRKVSTEIFRGKIDNDIAVKAIVGATLVHTEKEGVIENCVVIIEDNKIKQIGKWGEIEIPENAFIIPAKDKYLIPGLVDAHIHFFQSGGLYTRPDGLDLRHRMPYEQELDWIRENIDDVFKRYIRCGVTTVIDMGGPMWNFEIKEYSKKAPIAPRTHVAGPLIASYQPEALTTDDPPIIRVDSKAEALELVRKQAEAGTDFIKIWYIVSRKYRENAADVDDFFPIVKAVADEAHRLGLTLWVHATELETAKKAIRAGTDVLVHSVTDKKIDDEFINLAKANFVKLIPTAWVFHSYAAVYSKQLDLMPVEHLLGNPKVIGSLYDMYELSEDELGDRQKKLQAANTHIETNPVIMENLCILHENGITVAAGTDAGNVGVIHGPAIFHDFAIMKEAGLTDWEILVDATLNGARLLHNECDLGSIAEGKLADMVLLNKNPLEDIQNTQDIYLVIKDGVVMDPQKVIEPTPEDLVQIQLNAYNERDIDAFMAVYSPDVEVYEFPDKFLYSGRENMRNRYKPFFEKAEKLHCKLVNRIKKGKYIIDREFVTTGIPERDSLNAIAVYKVDNGYIQEVWFMH